MVCHRQTHSFHQGQRVAVGDRPRLYPVVEHQFAVPQLIVKMDIHDAAGRLVRDGRQREIVRGRQADRAEIDEAVEQGLCANPPVM